jgi:hypothetical protein
MDQSGRQTGIVAQAILPQRRIRWQKQPRTWITSAATRKASHGPFLKKGHRVAVVASCSTPSQTPLDVDTGGSCPSRHLDWSPGLTALLELPCAQKSK